MKAASDSIEFERLADSSELTREMIVDVRRGLSASPKWLPPKYFYDAHGSELFERITGLPEYYPTRTETALLEKWADEIVRDTRPDEIVEIGAGSSRKNQLLLEALEHAGGRVYVPIDVSQEALQATAAHLKERFEWLRFQGVVGDFHTDLARIPRHGRRLVCFLGSTIGNLEQTERVQFLRDVRTMLEGDEAFLLGVDLVKSRERLERAYDDSQGVTAEFNRNVLVVLNRELQGDLPVEAFEHRAHYDRNFERIEMHLVARRSVRGHYRRAKLDVSFEAGESIRTEISCKFRRERVERELALADLRLDRWIPDKAGDFALALARTTSSRLPRTSDLA